MNTHTHPFLIEGTAGNLECTMDWPSAEQFLQPAGLALVAHPHPLYGGTMNNKVTQTLARTFTGLGYVTVRMNFRGVRLSTGQHDHGQGETDDWQALLQFLLQSPESPMAKLPENVRMRLPIILAGFSFGAFVQSLLYQRLAKDPTLRLQRLILVGTPAKKWAMPQVPNNTLVIHGKLDETIPLTDVLEWAEPQNISVVVMPEADHFFHRQLITLKNTMLEHWIHQSD